MNKKLTIGLFIDTFFPMTDGVIMVVDNYARRLMKYANVIVFAPALFHNKFDDTILPYQVVRCHSIDIAFLDYSLPIPKIDYRFQKELNSYSLDIVHIHSPFMLGKAGINYAKKYHIPCVATMHSQFKQDFEKNVKIESIVNQLTKTIIRVFNQCDECWAVNKEVARIYYEDYYYKTMPKVMNNATEMLPVDDKKKANRYINKKYNIKNNEYVFLFVGRINTLKNILFIADSLKAVKEKRPHMNFKMLYVGDGQDMELLKNYINKLELSDNVILCGKVSDRYELSFFYSRADLFLFPSIYDASSIVQIEAASQMTPGVFLKGTATASTIIDNVNGFLSENSIGAYSDKIIEVLENKKLYDKVSNNAYIDLYHNWDDTIKDVYDNYLRLIKR